MSSKRSNPKKPCSLKCHHFCFDFDLHNYFPTCCEAGKGDVCDACVNGERPVVQNKTLEIQQQIGIFPASMLKAFNKLSGQNLLRNKIKSSASVSKSPQWCIRSLNRIPNLAQAINLMCNQISQIFRFPKIRMNLWTQNLMVHLCHPIWSNCMN